MRLSLFAMLLVCAACASPDPLVATFDATVTGTDTNTAPNTNSTSVSGPGTLSITADKELVGYIVTFGQDGYLCRVKATRSAATPGELTIAEGQACKAGTINAVTTGGTVTLDKATSTLGTMTVRYSYTYTVIINYAGNGTRTFTGPKL